MSSASDPALDRQSPCHTAALVDHLARRMRVGAESALAPLGLRPRHLVALTVLRDTGVSAQQGLAVQLRIDRTNLVGLLNELESDGLIVRRRSREDRRRHTVELTAAGLDRLARAESALDGVEDDVLDVLDGDQRAVLYELLQQVSSATYADCSEAAHERLPTRTLG